MKRNFFTHSLSPAEKIGILAFLLAALSFWFDTRLPAVPLAIFVALCFAAPFFPGLSFFFPVVARGNSGMFAVALTFDDGPDPLTTPLLLKLLAKYGFHATFFVNGKRIDKYPTLFEKILARGHEVGNHTYSHDNFIMLKSRRALKREIERTNEATGKFGVYSFAFRPPVGIVNPGLQGVLKETGMYAVTFSFRPIDAGNRRINGLAQRILKRVRSDDIILLHEKIPGDSKRVQPWLEEMDVIFAGLKEKGYLVLPLSELIGRPVMSFASTAQ